MPSPLVPRWELQDLPNWRLRYLIGVKPVEEDTVNPLSPQSQVVLGAKQMPNNVPGRWNEWINRILDDLDAGSSPCPLCRDVGRGVVWQGAYNATYASIYIVLA